MIKKVQDRIQSKEILSLDISSFSKLTSTEQVNTLNILNKILLTAPLIKVYKPILAPNGDGFHIIFKQKFQAFNIALYIKQNEYIINKVIPNFNGVRISVHKGEYFYFENILGNKGYMGDGIRETEKLTTMKELFFKESILVNVKCINKKYSEFDFKQSGTVHQVELNENNNIQTDIINIWNS